MEGVKPLNEILDMMHDKSEASKKLVAAAYKFADEAHAGQKRYSGGPYFLHPAEVAYSLAVIGMDAHAVTAGLLHDTLEDADVLPEEIERRFGTEVLQLVDGVTKLGALRYRGLERHTESLRKLFAATAKDIRVLIIKLMDRLHNARTLEFVPKNKRRRIGLETLEIYAPIANRLGMGVVKRQLEDAAFPHVYPREYKKVRTLLRERSSETKKRLDKTEKTLKRELAQAEVRNFRTEARVKGVYSLFRKLERKQWDITQIHDILALRVIVPNIANCYTILGIIHSQWRPMPGKIKDYIAFPKPNGYQSIHTTIYTGDGGTLEMQVRTESMHREAQFGIASHLSYKELNEYSRGKRGGGIEWIRQFLPIRRIMNANTPNGDDAPTYGTDDVPAWVKELADAHEEVDATPDEMGDIKSDFFSHRVFVFTPKGDVIDLPINATPIDFAYAIHSDIGNHMFGAKVNGKMVAIGTPLSNGDRVEILTRPNSKPTQKWYSIARTTLAKRHIRSAVQQQRNAKH